MQALKLHQIVAQLLLVLVLSVFALGCAAGGRIGLSGTPAEMGNLSSYQAHGTIELGNDRTGGFLVFQELRVGMKGLGIGGGVKFPIYIETEKLTFYGAPSLGFVTGYVGDEERSGLNVRLAVGLADRQHKGGGAIDRLFGWDYDTRTISLEVSQVMNTERFMPTTLVLSVGRLR